MKMMRVAPAALGDSWPSVGVPGEGTWPRQGWELDARRLRFNASGQLANSSLTRQGAGRGRACAVWRPRGPCCHNRLARRPPAGLRAQRGAAGGPCLLPCWGWWWWGLCAAPRCAGGGGQPRCAGGTAGGWPEKGRSVGTLVPRVCRDPGPTVPLRPLLSARTPVLSFCSEPRPPCPPLIKPLVPLLQSPLSPPSAANPIPLYPPLIKPPVPPSAGTPVPLVRRDPYTHSYRGPVPHLHSPMLLPPILRHPCPPPPSAGNPVPHLQSTVSLPSTLSPPSSGTLVPPHCRPPVLPSAEPRDDS